MFQSLLAPLQLSYYQDHQMCDMTYRIVIIQIILHSCFTEWYYLFVYVLEWYKIIKAARTFSMN